MTAKEKLGDGQSFVRGRSTAKAKDLIERLEASGDEGLIITTAFGYIVPTSILTDGESDSEDFTNVLPDGTAPEVDIHPLPVPPIPVPAEIPDEKFDPSTKTVEEVNAYLEKADQAEYDRVVEAERNGKNRKGIPSTTPKEQ
jgi:hypothetical protein